MRAIGGRGKSGGRLLLLFPLLPVPASLTTWSLLLLLYLLAASTTIFMVWPFVILMLEVEVVVFSSPPEFVPSD